MGRCKVFQRRDRSQHGNDLAAVTHNLPLGNLVAGRSRAIDPESVKSLTAGEPFELKLEETAAGTPSAGRKTGPTPDGCELERKSCRCLQIDQHARDSVCNVRSRDNGHMAIVPVQIPVPVVDLRTMSERRPDPIGNAIRRTADQSR